MKLVLAFFVLSISLIACKASPESLNILTSRISWDKQTNSFIERFHTKIGLKEIKKHGGNGKLSEKSFLYDDGSWVKIFYRSDEKKGSERYFDPTVSTTNSMQGLLIQYYPDSGQDGYEAGVPLYNGNIPAMIIYFFNNGTALQLEFSPNGTLEDVFSFKDDGKIL